MKDYDNPTCALIARRIKSVTGKAYNMINMKWVYYGFGAFIGFLCGTGINLIFYMLEQSGNRIISDVVRDYGMFGRFVAEMVNALPLMGLALGIVMIHWLFPDVVGGRKDSSEGEDRP